VIADYKVRSDRGQKLIEASSIYEGDTKHVISPSQPCTSHNMKTALHFLHSVVCNFWYIFFYLHFFSIYYLILLEIFSQKILYVPTDDLIIYLSKLTFKFNRIKCHSMK